jgi:hypothetical protein
VRKNSNDDEETIKINKRELVMRCDKETSNVIKEIFIYGFMKYCKMGLAGTSVQKPLIGAGK